MNRTSLSLAALARALLLRGPLPVATLWLGLAAPVAVAWALPLTESATLRGGLRQSLEEGAHLTVERPGINDFDNFTAFQRDAASEVDRPLSPYLLPGVMVASAGPLLPVSVNNQAVAQPIGDLRLAIDYLDDLAAHVKVVAGELPPDGLGGPYPAVTMPQAGADPAGLRLSDRFCADFAPGPVGRDPRWCGRLVGLWKPLRSSDPYWAGGPPTLAVAVGLYDFFELLKLHPPGGALAGRRYAADVSTVDPGSAQDLPQRLGGLRESVGGAGDLRLRMSLGTALSRYDDAQRATAQTINVLIAALALLALCLVQLSASRLVDLQAPDVGLLRARGWPPGQAWWFLFVQLCVVALPAIPAGLGGATLFITAGGLGAEVGVAPATADLTVAGLTLIAVLTSAVTVLAAVAWSASRDPGREPTVLGPAVAWWRWWNVDLLLAALALVLMLARPARPGSLLGAAPADDLLRFLAPVLAVATLALVALRALPLAGRLAARGRIDLPATLAGWQLQRKPEQHAGLVLFLLLAVAITGFCALNLAAQPKPVTLLDAIQHDNQAILITILLAVLTMALAGFWLHFGAAARARCREYAPLALNGLPASAARSSLGFEQLVVLAYGVVVGTLLALTLVAALESDVMGGGVEAEIGNAVPSLLAWATLPTGLVLVAWLVRRTGIRGGWLEELREG
jgi:hypothetical protein